MPPTRRVCWLGAERTMLSGLAKVALRMEEEQEFKALELSDSKTKGKNTLQMTAEMAMCCFGFFPPQNRWLSHSFLNYFSCIFHSLQ